MHEEVKSIKSGKYTLVARLYKGEFHGFLWANGKVIEDDLADSLDQAWRMVCSRLYAHLLSDAEVRSHIPHTAVEVRQSFLNIESRLSSGQKAMLRQHLKAENMCLTATQLAKAAGYKQYSGANLQYGLLGAMLYGEMPRVLPLRANGTPIMTFMIAEDVDMTQSSEEQWIWRMRKDIAEGLTASGIL